METVTKMRLSKETLTILKNFASINSNILIKPGKKIRSLSPSKNIYVEADIQEEFDVEVAIWDLNQFLGVISMFNNPDLEFNEKYVDISNGRSTVRYYYTSPNLLTHATKSPKFGDPIITFDIDEVLLAEILKAASILQVNDIKINAIDGKITILVDDSQNTTSNNFSIVIKEDYSGPDYIGKFNVSEIKFIPGSYTIEITDTIVSRFTHESGKILYYMAIEKV
jgi:hypothetical protein